MSTFWIGSSVTVTNGSPLVTVLTGDDTTLIFDNSTFAVAGVKPLEVKRVYNNGTNDIIELFENYDGSTGTVTAAVVPSGAAAAQAAQDAQALIALYETAFSNVSSAPLADSLVARTSTSTIKAANGVDADDVVNKDQLDTRAPKASPVFTGNVGIGTDSPSQKLQVTGNGLFTGNLLVGTSTPTSGDGSNFEASSATSSRLILQSSGSGGRKWGIVTGIGAGGALQLYDYTVGAFRATVDSSGNVGIGTSSPSSKLHVVGTITSEDTLAMVNADAGSVSTISGGSDSNLGANYAMFGESHPSLPNVHRWRASGSESMRIDSEGNQLISKTTLNADLAGHELRANGLAVHSASGLPLSLTRTGGDGDIIDLRSGTTTESKIGVITGGMAFKNGSGTERMRIDNSGNVLIGRTADDESDSGMTLQQDGLVQATRAGDPLSLRRTGSDGAIISLRRDASVVGSIGVVSGTPYFASQNAGIRVKGFAIIPTSSSGTATNGSSDLGESGARFRQLFVSTATSVVSDRNKKSTIEDLDAAELRVAKKAKTLLKKFRMKDRYEAEGEDARWHVGIIAQDLEQAFTDEGLDARRYSMFGADVNEETGEEELSIRYEELLAFIIGAL